MKQKKVSVWLPWSKADSLYCKLTARLQKKPGALIRMSSVQRGSPGQTYSQTNCREVPDLKYSQTTGKECPGLDYSSASMQLLFIWQ